MSKVPLGLEDGLRNLTTYIQDLKDIPGVYFFKNQQGTVLYIGKAKRLKRRVKSYLRWQQLPIRKQRMIAQISTVEVLITSTETEALLLEVNLIKKHRPPYNVLLKDDKTFPYIQLTGDHEYPRLRVYRGSRKEEGTYFGPFASSTAVYETYEILQKVFFLRTCSDNVFANRTRPCLLYDIKRCSAPCAEKISQGDYKALIKEVTRFFKGQTKELQDALANKMQQASKEQLYERAAIFRDRIAALTKMQEHQAINLPSTMEDLHIHGFYRRLNIVCIQVAFYQAGQHFGSKAYFPGQVHQDMADEEIMSAFLMQFYERHRPPKRIATNIEPLFKDLAQEALEKSVGHKVSIFMPKSGEKKQALDLALKNAIYALEDYRKEEIFYKKALKELQDLIKTKGPILRIEAYDNSHLMGTHPCGVMIVASNEGFLKSAYRKFSIKDLTIKTNDDYAMMKHVMERRFKKSISEEKDIHIPSVIVIDGGLGQLRAVQGVFDKLNFPKDNKPFLLAIAKGPNRNAGEEVLYLENEKRIKLPKNSDLLFFLQRVRDESHRFAISTHRQKKTKEMKKSALDQISGIGSKRKKALLQHFGSAKAVMQASVKDLQSIEGVNKGIAQKIYEHFHES